MDTTSARTQVRPVLLALLAGALAAVLPTLVTSVDEAGLTSALLALAVAALLGAAHDTVDLSLRGARVGPVARRPEPVLATRATDPTHHPLRPRAPGPA